MLLSLENSNRHSMSH